MPHIVELQKKYADKGVQVVSISDEPLDTVEEFLEREVPRSEETKTFRELTRSYSLTTDPDRSTHESYMEPAKQNGIPCAFIVGKDGKIEWIGHPMQMDGPLEAVVAGTWDRDKFAEEFKETQELDGLMQELQVKVGGLIRRKKFPEALEVLDEFVDKVKKPQLKLNFTMIKLNIHQVAQSESKDVAETFKKAFELAGDDPLIGNQIAWTVWEWKERGALEDKDTLAAALALAKKAAAKQEGNLKGMTLDTVAHLEYGLGNLEAAVKAQTEAVQLVDEAPQKEDMESFFVELKDMHHDDKHSHA
jgi:tetratricopeptide (TPR) repeat protein